MGAKMREQLAEVEKHIKYALGRQINGGRRRAEDVNEINLAA